MSGRKPGIGLLVLVVGICVGSISGAQETIFDPENTDFGPPETDGTELQGRGDARNDEGELIVDPENVDADEVDDVGGAKEADAFQRTTWRLEAELGGLVALPVGPEAMDPWEWVSGVGIEIRHEISMRTELVLSGRARYWLGSGGEGPLRTHFETRLDRAYVTHRRGRWSLSVGQLRNSWGSTDLTRPGDVIDPVDLRDPLGDGGLGAKLPQFSGNVGFQGDDWSIRALIVPFFQPNQLTLFGRDSALASEQNPFIAEQLPFLLLAEGLLDPSLVMYEQSFFQSTTRPSDLPQNASLGLRANRTVGGTDFGVGLFYGWDRTPYVELDEDFRGLLTLIARDGQIFADYDLAGFLQRNPEALGLSQSVSAKAEAGETVFASRHLRRTTATVDLARYIGRIGVRADVAFSPRRVLYRASFQPEQRASVFGALGLSFEELLDGERPLALIAEGFWLHVFDRESAMHRWFAASGARAESGDAGESEELLLFEDGYYGVALAANWHLPIAGLELEAGGQVSIQPGDLIARAGGRYRFGDHYYLRGGANFFLGPDPEERLTTAGLFRQNSKAYLVMGGQF